MLAVLLAAQIAVTAPSDPSEQDRVTEAEVLAYAEWRNCVLKVTHRASRKIKDHEAVADKAIDECGTREANYRASLTLLAQLYRLKDPDDFATRNVEQGRKALRTIALKELQ